MTTVSTQIPASPTEAEFHRRWRAAAENVGGSDVDLALAGGSMADRFAWVFISGYQAAVRRCFPEFAWTGWTCLAVAEPKDGPACTLEADPGGFRLNGVKSWIAGANSVESLVVSVGSDADRRFVRVPAHTPGVTLSHPRSPTFLKELSQGAARFSDTYVTPEQVVADPSRAQWFRGAEPLYVLLALNACLLAQAGALGDEALAELAGTAIGCGRPLSAHLGDKQRIVTGLKSLREATSSVIESAARLLDRFPAPLRESWEADAQIFRMFGVSGARP